MNNIKEIILPEGFVIDKIENGKIILKESNTIDNLPNTWEEWCENNPVGPDNDYIAYYGNNVGQYTGVSKRNPNKGIFSFSTEKYTRAAIALSKLLRLRDCYRMGWTPSTDTKFNINTPVIFHQKNIGMVVGHSVIGTDVFSFQSYVVAEKFYNNFKDLLDQIKPLYE